MSQITILVSTSQKCDNDVRAGIEICASSIGRDATVSITEVIDGDVETESLRVDLYELYSAVNTAIQWKLGREIEGEQ